MKYGGKYGISLWYEPGDWALPKWWTQGPAVREGTCSYQELVNYYSSPFMVNVLGHEGGITTLPTLMEKEKGHGTTYDEGPDGPRTLTTG